MTAVDTRPPGEQQFPPDEPARRRVRGDTATTLFVEAGAGSGKTTALVERIVTLVVGGHAELAQVAAITFTEKAGAELRDRVRTALQQARVAVDVDPVVAERCATAVDQLDGAAIGTLHSFAQRVLGEHPVEAGLPPRVDVLDEVGSGVEFDQRWARFRDGLFEDPDAERSLLVLVAAKVNRSALDVLAGIFEQNWDLVETRVPADAPEPPDIRDLIAAPLARIDAAVDECRHALDPGDNLVVRIGEFAALARELRSLDDELDVIEALESICASSPKPSFKTSNCGAKPKWPKGYDLPALRAEVRLAGEELVAARERVATAAVERLGSRIRRFTLASAAERRAEGRLAFHDLLVLARALVTDPEHGAVVRARLHDRYRHLLLDEFQDTDPIQIELAVRIAAADPSGVDAGTLPWTAVPLAPGHLFVVGDPKQSIYRFRRADLAVFHDARTHLAAEGDVVGLTTNFRTVEPVIAWVNQVFGRLMAEAPEVDEGVTPQATYVDLAAVRPEPPVGPPVSILGRSAHPAKTTADTMRAAEAADVAAAVVTAIGERWQVGTGDPEQPWRDARLGDVTILVPARTSVPFLQDALDAVGVPYRAESSSLVYATRAIRDLLMVARAASDPTNELHVVSALRTPLLGCGDDDLARYRVERRGHFAYLDEPPDSVPANDPVRRGLAYLAALHHARQWTTPSALLERIVVDRRALEIGVADGRPRDVWRRIRFVVEQARAWGDATGGGLRRYLAWVDLQSAEGARVAEAILPETDDDAVRIMTMHAAKGLEFPITILSGMSTVPGGLRAVAEVAFPPGREALYRVGRHVRSQHYETWKPIDEQMSLDERVRLLYVAATRARDHLVVSLHRKARSRPPASAQRTNAELIIAGLGGEAADALASVPDTVEVGATIAAVVPVGAAAPAAPTPYDSWRSARDTALARAGRPGVVSATGLSEEGDHEPTPDELAGLQKRARDLDLPPWFKGRYGTAVGRAVHATLQTIDLGRPPGPADDALLVANCEAEAVTAQIDDVRHLVAAALTSPTVREAAAHDHWREIYLSAPVGDRVVEGYVDLLYRRPDGYVVVDYKTAGTDVPVDLDHRVEGYALQGASYALLTAATTGEPVAEVRFVFLTPGGAVDRVLDRLDERVAEVRRLVAAGAEVLVDDPDDVS